MINDQVIAWKTSTPNQHLERGHVAGIIKEVYPDRNGHTHFSIKIGNGPKDTIEVIYNVEFGAIPNLATGMQVEACGDYITSTAATLQYQASPDDAIIHYIHKSTSRNHRNGFLMINGALCGQFRSCN